MHRRAQLGLLALAVTAAPGSAEWADPEIQGRVSDAQVRENILATEWSRYEDEVTTLSAQVRALSQEQLRASVECPKSNKKRGIWGFRTNDPGADCKMRSSGPVHDLRQSAKSIFADSRFGALSEGSRTKYVSGGMGAPGFSYVVHYPRDVFEPFERAEGWRMVMPERIWKDDVVGAGVALPASGYEDRYIGGRSFQAFLEDMKTSVAAAAKSVRDYRKAHRSIVDGIARKIRADAASGRTWALSTGAAFPHSDFAAAHSDYAALELPGDDDTHPYRELRVTNGYVWLNKYGAAAAFADASAPETEPEPEPEPENPTDGGGAPGVDEISTVELPVDENPDTLGIGRLDEVLDDTVAEEPPPSLPTSDEVRDTHIRTGAVQNSTNLYSGLLPLYSSGAWQEGMTPENQAARELAARSLSREVNFMGLGLDASDPARPRTDWDHGDELPPGVEIEDIEAEREALLLTIFAVEPAALGQSLDGTGLGAISSTEDAVGAFYGNASTIGELRSHVGTHVRPATTHHRSRIEGAASRLPPETLAKVQAELDAYRQAHDEYAQALTDLARFEGVNPLAIGDEPIPEDQRAARAEAAWSRLQALQEAAGALSQAAQAAAQPAGGK